MKNKTNYILTIVNNVLQIDKVKDQSGDSDTGRHRARTNEVGNEIRTICGTAATMYIPDEGRIDELLRL